MKVLVAMSGGIDSSVAAALLKKQGHEVIGVTMHLADSSGAAEEDARKVSGKLGISHYVIDFRQVFADTIITYFCREYTAGRTPNPCVLCNGQIKFGALWNKAKEMGADALATGHYATIVHEKDQYLLKKGADLKKDQSYFLYRLAQEQLRHTLFPLAALTKDKVKLIAREMQLPTANRPESQEICFIPDNDYAGFFKEYSHINAGPGLIIDGAGKMLGEHNGIFNFTIGQRKRLGIAAAEPLYVTSINAAANAITVGGKDALYCDELVAGDLNWIAFAPPGQPFKAAARIRYHQKEAEALITPVDDDQVQVKFTTPQMAITPGQSAVFYDGDTVIGGGTILTQGR